MTMIIKEQMLTYKKPTSTKLYFAYGANMHEDNMKYRCPDAVPIGPFVLKDWQLKFYTHANIEYNKGAEVAGVLWKITNLCEYSLDRFEGHPVYYVKQEWYQDGKKFFFYEMTDPRVGKPHPWYVDDIVESYWQWQLPMPLLETALEGYKCS